MDNLTAGNPRAHRVRVYYDGSSTIAEGMPVCYNYLTTDNWWGGSVSNGEVTANETTAEGSHNKGKYIYVSNPTCVSTETDADGAVTPAGKIITGDGDDFDDLQVGMFVSVSSATDSTVDGNYKITAHNVAGDTITLEMTTAFTVAAAGADDIVVKMDNIGDFAGIVTKGGWCGKTGPRVLDIYVPNGAVVPVLTELTATVAGRTILSLLSATQTLGNPETDIDSYGFDTVGQLDSRPVAIAAETISSAGLVLAKLDPNIFTYQCGMDSQELEVAAGTVGVTLNRITVNFANTAGNQQTLHYRTKLGGVGGVAQRGVYRFETFITAATDASVIGLDSALDFTAAPTGGAYMAPIRSTVRSRLSDPSLAGVGMLCAYYMDWALTNAAGNALTAGPTDSCVFYLNNDSAGLGPQHFIIGGNSAVGAYPVVANDVGFGAANDIAIPIILNGQHYIILGFADLGLA